MQFSTEKIRSDVLDYFDSKWAEMRWKHRMTRCGSSGQRYVFNCTNGLESELVFCNESELWSAQSYFKKFGNVELNNIEIVETEKFDNWEITLDTMMEDLLIFFCKSTENSMNLLEALVLSDSYSYSDHKQRG